MDLRVEREDRGRVIRRRIRVRQTASERAAVAHLLIADRRSGLGEHRARVAHDRGRRHLVMDRAGADFDLVANLADARQPGNPRDVDEELRLAQPQLHERHEAVAPGNQLARGFAVAQLLDRLVERCRARLYYRCVNMARPPSPLITLQSFPGRSIMSRCLTPNSLSASIAADTMHGVEPSVPASPTPLAPNGLTGVGVTVAESSKRGKSIARGIA